MSTLCWIAFYAVVKNTPAWCEQKWPKATAIFPLVSNPRSSLLTSVLVCFSVHTTRQEGEKTYPVYDNSLSRLKQRSIAPVQESNQRFVCE